MKYLAVIGSFILCACADPRAPEHAVPKSIISEHIRAFNAGDVEAMAKMQHPDIEWLSVSGTNLSIEVSGREALSQNMTEYFKSPTKVTGQLRGWSINMPYISVTETATWATKDGTACLIPNTKFMRDAAFNQFAPNRLRNVS